MGDRLRAIYDITWEKVYMYASRRCTSHDAEEVTADTFITIWQKIDSAPAVDSELIPWAIGIARNHLMHAVRGHAQHARIVNAVGEIASTRPGHAEDVSEHAVERTTAEQALASMPDHLREALTLVGWEGLTVPQAAALQGVEVEAFKSRLRRARKHITHALEGDVEGTNEPRTASTAKSLPTDPTSLERVLADRFTCEPGGDYAYCLMVVISELPQAWVVPPDAYARIWSLLARTPGFTTLGTTKDRLGRSGVAIAASDSTDSATLILVVDPATGSPLGSESISFGWPESRHAPQVESFTAFVTSEWVTEIPHFDKIVEVATDDPPLPASETLPADPGSDEAG